MKGEAVCWGASLKQPLYLRPFQLHSIFAASASFAAKNGIPLALPPLKIKIFKLRKGLLRLIVANGSAHNPPLRLPKFSILERAAGGQGPRRMATQSQRQRKETNQIN